MSRYEPTPRHLQEVLLFFFNKNIEVAKVYLYLTTVYGMVAVTEEMCANTYKRFEQGDFQIKDEKKDDKTLHDLKIFERRLCICEILLERLKREGFLHHIVTGGETYICYGNATPTATAVLHIWWDHLGVVYYRLFQSIDEASNCDYKKRMINLRKALKTKRMQCAGRREQVILQHEDDEYHIANVINDFEQSRWEVLPHPPCSRDIAPTYYHLFRDMENNMPEEKRFRSYDELSKWIERWIKSKTEAKFFENAISELPKRWQEVVEKNGHYLET